MEALRQTDPEIFEAVRRETLRQNENIELIASENFTSTAVMEAVGSALTTKSAEGYPEKRWYGGCENVDMEDASFHRGELAGLDGLPDLRRPTAGHDGFGTALRHHIFDHLTGNSEGGLAAIVGDAEHVE